MATTSSTTSSNGSSTSRWAGLADSGPRSSSFNRGGSRGRGNARGGRGGRGGGKGSGGPVREPVKLEASQEKFKPSLAKPAAATALAESSERTPTTPKSKNPSRRLSRSIPAPIATQLSGTPSTELPTPTPRNPHSNRRRRSQADRGPALTSKVAPNDNSAKQDSSLLAPPVPYTAPSPATDASHRVARDPTDDRSPAEMRTNIDALVEHVRAVAMADNRPTTPGSHIDWAGDDDDSLPDLNDWGIPTLAPTQTISPIIVGGLKPLPEPIAKPFASQTSVKDPSPLAKDAASSHADSQAEQENKPPVALSKRERNVPTRRAPGWDLKNLHPSLPNRPGARNATPSAKPVPNVQAKGVSLELATPAADPEPKPPAPGPEANTGTEAAAPDIIVTTEEALSTPTAQLVVPEPSTGTSQTPERKSLAGSIHAPASARDPLFGGIGDKSGLAASIHAPKSPDATSAPATMPSYNLPPREPTVRHHDGGQWGHSRRPASTNSHPRGQHLGGRGQNHSRNHSSPHTYAVDAHKQPHARPVINADAISRLARTIVSTTPKSAPIVSASSD